MNSFDLSKVEESLSEIPNSKPSQDLDALVKKAGGSKPFHSFSHESDIGVSWPERRKRNRIFFTFSIDISAFFFYKPIYIIHFFSRFFFLLGYSGIDCNSFRDLLASTFVPRWPQYCSIFSPLQRMEPNLEHSRALEVRLLFRFSIGRAETVFPKGEGHARVEGKK